jgi:hypothetical protein
MKPLTLPPAPARLATNRLPTGSATIAKTLTQVSRKHRGDLMVVGLRAQLLEVWQPLYPHHTASALSVADRTQEMERMLDARVFSG